MSCTDQQLADAEATTLVLYRSVTSAESHSKRRLQTFVQLDGQLFSLSLISRIRRNLKEFLAPGIPKRWPMQKAVSQFVFCAVFAFAMFAQSSTGNSGQASGSTSSSSSDPYQSSQTSSSAGGQNNIEGCIFERRTAYYMQPANGGAPTQLSAGNQDLASHVGQDVRVSGTMGNGNSGTSASNNATGSTGSVAGSADQGQVMLVTRVDEVAKRCPADTQQQINKDNNAASPQ